MIYLGTKDTLEHYKHLFEIESNRKDIHIEGILSVDFLTIVISNGEFNKKILFDRNDVLTTMDNIKAFTVNNMLHIQVTKSIPDECFEIAIEELNISEQIDLH